MSDYISSQQARFHELRKKSDSIRAISGPKREERDRIVNANREVELKLDAEIAEIEKDLPAIASELGFISRGLAGNTGEPPADGA